MLRIAGPASDIDPSFFGYPVVLLVDTDNFGLNDTIGLGTQFDKRGLPNTKPTCQ